MRRSNSRAVIAILLLSMASVGYGPCPKKNPLSSVEGIDRVEAKLNQAANALNTLAKTNRALYQKNVINLNERRTVAGVINKANTGLDKITDRVFQIDPNNPDSIASGKIDAVVLLNTVSVELGKINFGPEELRLAVQAIIAIVNEAIDLTRRVKEIR